MSWIFLAVALVIISRTSVGQALADRLRQGGRRAGPDPRFDDFAAQVTEDLAALRAEVTDLGERLDFTERALLQLRRPDAAPQVHAVEREAGTA